MRSACGPYIIDDETWALVVFIGEMAKTPAQQARQIDTTLDQLRELWPHGHPHFISRMVKLIELHSEKNHDYAMGGPPLGNFERVSQIMQLYPEFPWATPYGVATCYMLKQLDAYMWQQRTGFKPKVEGVDSRLSDVTVYSQIIALSLKEAGNGKL